MCRGFCRNVIDCGKLQDTEETVSFAADSNSLSCAAFYVTELEKIKLCACIKQD